LQEEDANELFSYLEATMPWSKSDLEMYGKTLKTPRFQCWMGDENVKAEVYSDARVDWDPKLLLLKEKLEKDLDFSFNYLLLNFYKTGDDYIGYHSDNEVLTPTDLIGSLSLNGPRRFTVQSKPLKDEKYEVILNSGDLMVMDGEMQRFYKHSIPKTRLRVNPRINLTFRKAK